MCVCVSTQNNNCSLPCIHFTNYMYVQHVHVRMQRRYMYVMSSEDFRSSFLLRKRMPTSETFLCNKIRYKLIYKVQINIKTFMK